MSSPLDEDENANDGLLVLLVVREKDPEAVGNRRESTEVSSAALVELLYFPAYNTS